MTMRRFLIYLPESDLYESQTVDVREHETLEQAILREGDASEEWVLYRELPLED